MLLGVNIDHVATLRQARYATMLESHNAEPSPLQAAWAALEGGADSLTMHVRGDRRHVQESDVFAVREEVPLPLNLEMGNTPEMVELALELKPDFVCLVPETREEITTEGGLDVLSHYEELVPTLEALSAAEIKVSLFIDPELAQVKAAAKLGAPMIELHTGAFANALGKERAHELARLKDAAKCAHGLGLQVNAGHGLNYQNIPELLAQVPYLAELNIGHTIISSAIFVGLSEAVREMKELVSE